MAVISAGKAVANFSRAAISMTPALASWMDL